MSLQYLAAVHGDVAIHHLRAIAAHASQGLDPNEATEEALHQARAASRAAHDLYRLKLISKNDLNLSDSALLRSSFGSSDEAVNCHRVAADRFKSLMELYLDFIRASKDREAAEESQGEGNGND